MHIWKEYSRESRPVWPACEIVVEDSSYPAQAPHEDVISITIFIKAHRFIIADYWHNGSRVYAVAYRGGRGAV